MRSAFGLWPTWLPGASASIGEFGHVESGMFESQGRLDIPPELLASPSAFGDHFFMSEGVTKSAISSGVNAGPAGSVGTEFQFGSTLGIVVALRRCQVWRVSSTNDLALHIREVLPYANRRFAFVTSVVTADSILVAIASSKGARMAITADAGVPGDVLANLDGEVRISRELNLGYRAVLSGGCNPLFGLARMAGFDAMKTRGSSTTAASLDLVSILE